MYDYSLYVHVDRIGGLCNLVGCFIYQKTVMGYIEMVGSSLIIFKFNICIYM
jgi:hypothetical protein